MAKKNMTLEEKLEEAIVKDAPYEVPGNWVWSKIGSFTNVKSSKRILAKEYKELGIPFYRSKEIVELSLNKDVSSEIYISTERYKEIHDKFGMPQQGDLLITSVGTIGNTWIVDDRKFYYKDGNITQIDKNDILSTKYIQKYIESPYFDIWVKDIVSGSAYNALTIDKLKSLAIPIPPLKEQQRIVDRIESLFEKLDKAKELIEEAREGFEKRKASITSKAFRGKLNHRIGKLDIKNGINGEKIYDIPFNWKWVKLKDVCKKITDGTHNSPKSYETGDYKYITAKNIKEWGIDLSNITYLTKEDHEVIYTRCDVKCGDILYIKDGATTGIATVNEIEEEFSLLSSVAVLRVGDNIINKYLYYALNSFEIKKIILQSVKGVAITRLTLKKINDIMIPLPPLDEQKEIVKILDKLLEEESKVEELTQLEDQIELIKKSILAKAFRGELGTNCEEDESALELLKEILSKE